MYIAKASRDWVELRYDSYISYIQRATQIYVLIGNDRRSQVMDMFGYFAPFSQNPSVTDTLTAWDQSLRSVRLTRQVRNMGWGSMIVLSVLEGRVDGAELDVGCAPVSRAVSAEETEKCINLQ